MAKVEDAVSTATVYVVDDDDGMRRALSLLLTTVGYKTAAFASPKEFLDRFRPDVRGLPGPRYPHAGDERTGAAAALKSHGIDAAGDLYHRPRGCANGRAGDERGRF